MSEVCRTQGPLVDHPAGSAKGVVEQLSADMRCYRTGSGNRVGIVAGYDIIGFNVEQTRLFCDQLAEATGGTLIIPDYFQGTAWKPEDFPIRGDMQEKWDTWLKNEASPDRALKATLELVLPYVRRFVGDSAPVAFVGFCWGAWLGTKLLADSRKSFSCAVGLHPSMQSQEEVSKILVPMALFPADNDPDMSTFFDTIPDRKLRSQCVHRRFAGTSHGWCTKRADLSDPQQAARQQAANKAAADFILSNIQ